MFEDREPGSPTEGVRGKAIGFACVLGATLLWSAVPVCAKISLHALDSYTIAWLRFAVGSLMLLALAGLRGTSLRIDKPDLRLIALAAFGIGGNYVLYIRGIQDTTASAANVIVQFEVISLVLLSYFWLRERMSAPKVAGMLVTFAGVFLAVWDGSSLSGLIASRYFAGNLLILLASPGWALYGAAQKLLADRGVSVYASLVWIFGLAAMLTLPVAAVGFDVRGQVTLGVAAALLILVALSTVGAYLLLGKGLTLLDASTAGVITCLLPVFTIVNARIFLSERISAVVALGAMLVVFGICVIGHAESRTARRGGEH